jgi:hypothetical protein
MSGIGAAFDRLITVGALPNCPRCGVPMTVSGEERVAMVPPVFDVTCRCADCRVAMRVRQVLLHLE